MRDVRAFTRSSVSEYRAFCNSSSEPNPSPGLVLPALPSSAPINCGFPLLPPPGDSAPPPPTPIRKGRVDCTIRKDLFPNFCCRLSFTSRCLSRALWDRFPFGHMYHFFVLLVSTSTFPRKIARGKPGCDTFTTFRDWNLSSSEKSRSINIRARITEELEELAPLPELNVEFVGECAEIMVPSPACGFGFTSPVVVPEPVAVPMVVVPPPPPLIARLEVPVPWCRSCISIASSWSAIKKSFACRSKTSSFGNNPPSSSSSSNRRRRIRFCLKESCRRLRRESSDRHWSNCTRSLASRTSSANLGKPSSDSSGGMLEMQFAVRLSFSRCGKQASEIRTSPWSSL
mmetsp:Transcript_13847/g.34147  ORF Transcript_13847/g.34147 Transcript_13847/m.34147 type:complete len:343 (+) Transcript_13847:983-2011(+)